MDGKKFLEALSAQDDVPSHLLENEIQKLMSEKGKDINEADIEDIREVLVNYLQDTILEAKDNFTE